MCTELFITIIGFKQKISLALVESFSLALEMTTVVSNSDNSSFINIHKLSLIYQDMVLKSLNFNFLQGCHFGFSKTSTQ